MSVGASVGVSVDFSCSNVVSVRIGFSVDLSCTVSVSVSIFIRSLDWSIPCNRAFE